MRVIIEISVGPVERAVAMDFMRPRSVAKILCDDEDGRHFLGEVLRLHRDQDEYEVLDRHNGETHYFKSWGQVSYYVMNYMRWNAFFIYHKKEVANDALFAI